MGNRNPMAEFVVAPKICIVSPMFVSASDKIKQIVTRTKVARAFSLVESLVFFGLKSYSIVSLHGRRVSGVAKKITNYIPKRDTRLTLLVSG